MIATLLTLAIVAAPDAGGGHVRSVGVAVLDKKDVPLADLRPADLLLREGGSSREVLGLEPDTRPIEAAVVLDSSASMVGSYRGELVPAALAFWRGLPAGTRVAVWTTGGAPSEVVPAGVDVAAAEARLQQVACGGRNQVLDTIVDASRELGRRGGERRVLAVVTASDAEGTPTLMQRVYDAVAAARVAPAIVLIQEGAAAAQRWDAETLFERLAKAYGGSYKLVLTPLASARALQAAAAGVRGQYRVRYASDSAGPTRPEVKISRKGCRVQQVGIARDER